MHSDDVEQPPKDPSKEGPPEDPFFAIKQQIEMARKVSEDGLADSKHQVEEIEKMFASMRNMQADLDEKMEMVRAEAKRHNVDIDRYLKNVPDLTAKERELADATVKELKNKIAEAVPPEACIQPQPKSKDKLTKERKGKTRGARNKWLPMP